MSEAPSSRQEQLAALCGISLAGLSRRSSAALLSATLAEDVLGVVPITKTTDAQKDISQQLGIKSLSAFKEVARLQIQAEFVRLNDAAMAKHQFVPGMFVVFVGGPHVQAHTHALGEIFQISTIGRDHRIYFKATNGAGAFPSQLEPQG